MSVSDRFKTLLSWATMSSTQDEKFASHLSTVRTRLRTVFGVTDIPLIGSMSRGSAGAYTSDADLLLKLPVAAVEWGNNWKLSSTVLKDVRDQLQDRYINTEVGRDGQAVVVRFGQGEYAVDVVPAVYSEPWAAQHNYPIYWIPDGKGDWMKTSPQAHNRYIGEADDRATGKLKMVARIFKYWNACRNPWLPLNSFHLELLMAQSDVCVGPKSYAQCVFGVLKLLDDRQCRGLQDPLGLSGLIEAASTQPKRERLIQAVDASCRHSAKAIIAEIEGPLSEAYSQWEYVFNSHFPKS